MPLDLLGRILGRGKTFTDLLQFSRNRAVRWQENTLKKMIFKARNTAFAKEHRFDEVLIAKNLYEAFRNHVPVNNYSSMQGWWQKAYQGESDVTWPGTVKYFALSSGTSDGSSKYIPVTEDMLKSIMRASTRQLIQVVKTDLPKDYLAKHHLMVGGSTDLQFDGTSYAGDLSGITSSNIPFWFERFSQPSHEIKRQKNWHEKIEKMVAEAPQWDVVSISGVPAWIKILFEKIIDTYQLETIHDIWPNFSIYVWGGVSLQPYKNIINGMLAKPIKFFETYLASEGFIAFQMKEESLGMRLVFKNNVYYEFIPFNENNFNENGDLLPGAKTLDISEVKEGVNYALLITTCAGAWRYLIGDTIQFVSVEDCEIRITGRTKHFLSICGEHLSVDNMNMGIAKVSSQLGIEIPEYTVKGLHYQGKFIHQWYIACNHSNVSAEEIKSHLDRALCELNDDYAVERQHALQDINITLLPESVFLGWLESRGKLGGQSKFPRVISDHLYSHWTEYLSNLNIPAS